MGTLEPAENYSFLLDHFFNLPKEDMGKLG